jgi:hypothetical protein
MQHEDDTQACRRTISFRVLGGWGGRSAIGSLHLPGRSNRHHGLRRRHCAPAASWGAAPLRCARTVHHSTAAGTAPAPDTR